MEKLNLVYCVLRYVLVFLFFAIGVSARLDMDVDWIKHVDNNVLLEKQFKILRKKGKYNNIRCKGRV